MNHYGDGLFDDELAHLPEHSIELEVVFLQYLYAARRPFRIVALVVGPFQDCLIEKSPPRSRPDIARMIEALRRLRGGNARADLLHHQRRSGAHRPQVRRP